jgi:ATP-binding cassette subfamily F protein uup
MLDRVSTIVLGLDGNGGAERFSDYAQWEQWRGVKGEDLIAPSIAPGAAGKAVSSTPEPAATGNGKKKLSYLEAREYAGIEAAVDAAENRLQAAREAMEDPAVVTDAVKLTAALAEMEAAQDVADNLYARWAELSEKAG